MRMPRRLVTLGLVLALAAIPAAPAAAGGGYTITDLGTFGGTYSVASAVNDNGIVVGQAEYPNGDAHAFLYGGALPLTDLMTLGGSFSDATDVNSNKEVVGDAADSADHDQSFRWPGGGSLQLIPTLGGLGGFALAVNDGGVIVGDADTATGELHVYMYDGSLTDVSLFLAPLGATVSVVADINASKEIVGQAVLSSFVHARAFRWTPGHQAELLGTLPGGSEAGARAVNDNGQVVGNSNSGVAADFHAFLYTGGTRTDLNTLLLGGSPWLLDQANDINETGQIVGGGYIGSEYHAYLLTPNTPAGTNVSVDPVDQTTGTSPVTLTFASVTQGGGTTLATSASGPSPPAGFSLGNPPTYYELSTTASFSGSIEVCIDSTGISFPGPPTLWHHEGGTWVNVTTSVNGAIVCGSVTSLSPFALFAAPAASAYHLCLLYDPDRAAKAGSTIPIKLQLCDAAGANLSSPAVTLHAEGVKLVSTSAPGSLADSGNANPDGNFRYDATLGGTGGYIYNFSTKGLATGTYALEFRVGSDTHLYAAQFQVR